MGVSLKSLEENHSPRIKKRSLLGHIICSEEAKKKDSRVGHLPYSRI